LKTLSLVLREESGTPEFENKVLRIFNPYKRKREAGTRGRRKLQSAGSMAQKNKGDGMKTSK